MARWGGESRNPRLVIRPALLDDGLISSRSDSPPISNRGRANSSPVLTRLTVVEHWGPFSYEKGDRDEEFTRLTYTYDGDRSVWAGLRYPLDGLTKGTFSNPIWKPIKGITQIRVGLYGSEPDPSRRAEIDASRGGTTPLRRALPSAHSLYAIPIVPVV